MPLLLLTALAQLASGSTASNLGRTEPPVASRHPTQMEAKPSINETVNLPMPPPPPGMKLLAATSARRTVSAPSIRSETSAAPEGDETPDSETSKEAEEESVELEELKALEEAALEPVSSRPVDRIQSLHRLGYGHPLRERMMSALRKGDLQTGFGQLRRITDLASFDVKAVESHYDIPVEVQPLVVQYIQFFQGPGRKWFRNWMSRSTRFIPMMQPVLEKNGVPKDTVYLAMIESGFSAHAYSWANASGPWQFIAATGKRFGLSQDFWLDERRDPVKATEAAAKYLKELHDALGHWYLAWAGYNAGGGRISKMIERRSSKNFWELCEGKGLAKETKHYVPKLIAAALVAKHYEAFGFSKSEFNFLPPLQFEEVPLTDAVELDVLARAGGIDVKVLEELNPELKRWCTPPASEKKPYLLKVPIGRKEVIVSQLAKLGPSERMTFRSHSVRKGDTLSLIASKYGSAPEAIMRLNGLKSAKYLRVNNALMIPIPTHRSAEGGALTHQVARARRAGFVAVRPEDEIPAGTQTRSTALSGPVKTEEVDGKTRVTYGIASGDTLWSISQRFDCGLDDLRSWNGIIRKQKNLKVGALLTIWPGPKAGPVTVVTQAAKLPAASSTAAVSPVPASMPNTAINHSRPLHHVLASGESLWSVAQRYGITVDDLKAWNRITDAKPLKVGSKLSLSP